jgi:N-acetylneuraminate synthase
MPRLRLGNRWIGDAEPTYFIADISANHDGELERARLLIHLAAESGANAAKFQNFRAPKIVSERGFASLGRQVSHQASWKKTVYQVYQAASLPWEWTAPLRAECDAAGIEYFSTPYDFDAVDMLDPFVSVFKVGSGDITWLELLRKIADMNKPVLLSTGASDIGEVQRAVREILTTNQRLVLMQCNTNYSGSPANLDHVNLNVLKTYRVAFPEVVLGLSDHTPGHVAVLGAVALGARVVEKHFTDDTSREGPDHPFSLTPRAWQEMVARTRDLERALGSTEKTVTDNERETIIVQRRCLRAALDLKAGTILRREHVEVLRPAPSDAIFPQEIGRILGMRLRADVSAGEHLRWSMLEVAS